MMPAMIAPAVAAPIAAPFPGLPTAAPIAAPPPTAPTVAIPPKMIPVLTPAATPTPAPAAIAPAPATAPASGETGTVADPAAVVEAPSFVATKLQPPFRLIVALVTLTTGEAPPAGAAAESMRPTTCAILPITLRKFAPRSSVTLSPAEFARIATPNFSRTQPESEKLGCVAESVGRIGAEEPLF